MFFLIKYREGVLPVPQMKFDLHSNQGIWGEFELNEQILQGRTRDWLELLWIQEWFWESLAAWNTSEAVISNSGCIAEDLSLSRRLYHHLFWKETHENGNNQEHHWTARITLGKHLYLVRTHRGTTGLAQRGCGFSCSDWTLLKIVTRDLMTMDARDWLWRLFECTVKN